jgi:hypothetical protein
MALLLNISLSSSLNRPLIVSSTIHNQPASWYVVPNGKKSTSEKSNLFFEKNDMMDYHQAQHMKMQGIFMTNSPVFTNKELIIWYKG